MSLTNKLKKQIDLPVWEWLRFCPIVNGVGGTMCYGDDFNERYIYYLDATFWRYDTWSDAWQQLNTPPTLPTISLALKYTTYGGHRGGVISAGNNTVEISGLQGKILVDHKIRIISGTGMGQERTITGISENITHDNGVITGIQTNYISDSTKKWKLNQWRNYQVRIKFGTGQSIIRKVLYNDPTTLYFYDQNWIATEYWNNNALVTSGSYVLPIVTAGSQAHFVIESSIATVDTNWTVNPDHTSKYVILSGGIFALTTGTTNSVFMYYDIATDTWMYKTPLGSLIYPQNLTVDWVLERTGEVGGAFESGTATSGTSTTLVDTAKTLEIDGWTNYQIRIVAGTGIGQRRRIEANNANSFTVECPWTITPDATSQYQIFGDTNKMYLVGSSQAAIFQYSIEEDLWATGNTFDYGIARNGAVLLSGYPEIAITAGVRSTNSVLTINPVPVAGGASYSIGDILNLSTGGSNGQVRVTSIAAGGIVTGVELYRAGSGYSVTTSATTGNGSGCTIAILTIGTTGRINTALQHNFKVGDTVVLTGASDALWNGTFVVIGCDHLSYFEIAISATGAWAAYAVQGTTLLVDSTKNWIVNEHVGKVVSIVSVLAGYQNRRITANTATALTLQSTITSATNGTSRYVIQEVQCFGREESSKDSNKLSYGRASGGSTTTLIDSSKTWIPNQWANYKFRIRSGTGQDSELTITSNTANTLTYATQTFTPDASTKYVIMDTFGLATAGGTTTLSDSTKNWKTNQFAGKRLRIVSGTGQCQETVITSNTNTQLTFTALTTTTSTDSTYCILANPARGTAPSMNWMFGNTNVPERGKFMIMSRGGNTALFDKYDITKGLYDFTLYCQPQMELLTSGSMFCYDGADSILFTVNATGRVFSLNVKNGEINACGITPYAHSTVRTGNKFELVKTEDGLKYLYVMRHSGQELWRCLIFWE